MGVAMRNGLYNPENMKSSSGIIDRFLLSTCAAPFPERISEVLMNSQTISGSLLQRINLALTMALHGMPGMRVEPRL